MKKQCLTKNFSQTQRLGKSLAEEVLKTKGRKKAFVLALEGDLGGGKTTFLQGFARGLGIKKKIVSPTFVIMKRFPFHSSGFSDFYHFDCYRIQRQKEIADIGFKKIISDPRHIVAIEWADRIRKTLPKEALSLRFSFVDRNKRRIIFEEHDAGR